MLIKFLVVTATTIFSADTSKTDNKEASPILLNISTERADTLKLSYAIQNEGYNATFVVKELPLIPGQNSFKIDSIKGPTRVLFFLASDKRFHRYSTYVIPNQQLDCSFDKRGLIIANETAAQIAEVARTLDSIKDNMKFRALDPDIKQEHTWGLSVSRQGIILDQKLQYLSAVKTKIPLEVYESMRSDIVGEYLQNTADYLKRRPTSSHEVDAKSMNATIINLSHQILDRAFIELPFLTRYTSNLLIGCYQLSTLNSRILKNGEVSDFEGITTDFQGDLRTKVLLFSFIYSPQRSSPEIYKCALESARSFVTSNADREFLKRVESTSIKGVPFYPFALTDPNERIQTLKDFNGKIIVMDFWFTGCSGCAALAKVLDEKVIPTFKGKNVVFVSVNLDVKKSQWLASVQSGKYTSSESINLFTAGEAFNHPFAKYYNLNGGPYLMLIDRQGKLVTTEIPRRTAEEIINAINSAL